MWFDFSPNYPKPVETCKIKRDALNYSKNSQILHESRIECPDQLSQLC
jgi:hypothetical protein